MFGQTFSVFVSYLVLHDQCLLVLHSTIFIGLLTGYTAYTECYATICIAYHCFVIFLAGWLNVTHSMQDGLTGSAWGDWANYTASPLRAFENELGVQAPVGFWDPAGLSSDGSVENFKRRRQTELKHGRISMLATMGYITPEITGKFPGYLSPSAGLKFADVPNGLAAISKVPAAGWGQILAYMAFCEVSQDQSAGTPAAAGDFGWKLITSTDPEVKKTKLNAELANGRLAMMAIIGMFFQVMKGKGGMVMGDV